MPRTNKAELRVAFEAPGYEGRFAELDDFTIAYEYYSEDSDPAEFFKGLPDDRCQCPHWGVVTSGQIVFRYADHEETYREGDAYYASPGHLPLMFAGGSVTEFSPTAKLNETMAVIQANLEAATAANL